MGQTLVERLQQRRADKSEVRRLNGYLVGRDRIALWNVALETVVRRDEAMRRLDRVLMTDPSISGITNPSGHP
jgi:hypothetical protein